MKFKLRERFSTPEARKKHYDLHYPERLKDIHPDMSEEEYEQRADEIARSPVGGDLEGYVTRKTAYDGTRFGDPRYIKYNRATGEFVAYQHNGKEPIINTYHTKSSRQYNRLRDDEASNYSAERKFAQPTVKREEE